MYDIKTIKLNTVYYWNKLNLFISMSDLENNQQLESDFFQLFFFAMIMS